MEQVYRVSYTYFSPDRSTYLVTANHAVALAAYDELNEIDGVCPYLDTYTLDKPSINIRILRGEDAG